MELEFYNYVSDSFEKKLPAGVIKAVNEDIYGAFRIQCTCAGIQWRSFVSNKYATWLFHKSAFKILIGIMKEAFKREREGKSVIFDWNRFVYNMFSIDVNLEIIEEIMNTFKDEFEDAELRIAELVKESHFVCRTYGIGQIIENDHNPARVYEMFERVFPGSNIFPKPEGTWTDPKDGKTYETLKTKRGIEVMRVPYGNPMTMDEADDDAIPKGWRLVTYDEADLARKVGAWNPIDLADRFIHAHYASNPSLPVIEDSLFLFPTYSQLTCKTYLSGIYMSTWNEPRRYEVKSMGDLIDIHNRLEKRGIDEKPIDPVTCKASLMLCRGIIEQ